MRFLTPGGRRFQPYMDMLSSSHLLVAGCTGSGKSVLINSMISTMLLESPAQYQLILLDPKTTELWQWAKVQHTIRYTYEQADMLKALRLAVELMENRLRHMHSVGERLWSGSKIVVVIDELADLLTTRKAEVVPVLQRLLQLGRAAGIMCLMGTQCLLASVLPTQLKVNIPAIICLRVANKQQSRFIIDQAGAELFPDPKKEGKAYGFFRSGADLQKFVVYRVPDEEQARLVSWWSTPSKCIID